MKILKLIIILCFCAAIPLHAQIRLPKLIADNMVLQRDQPVKVWGWASPKERVKLLFDRKSYTATASASGKWEIGLPAHPAGTGYSMVLKGRNEIRIANIAFGDVWLCSGQSNMVINMERVKERFPEDIASANYPDIRNFFVPTLTNLNGPTEDFPKGEWKTANPKDVLGFGAVSYFFAREIFEKHKVPIGIINSSVGGTPIEAWISAEGFHDFADIQKTISQNRDTSYVNSFLKQTKTDRQDFETDSGVAEHWESNASQPKGWRNFNIPGYWEDQGLKALDGVVWFRKTIQIPQNWTGKPVKLFMGRIVDADEMYVNGQKIGNITYQYPPRRYEIPGDLLKPGPNTFVIRVTNTAGKGGFVPDKPYFMTIGSDTIDLKGTWQYKVGAVFPNETGANSNANRLVHQNQPGALYNAMIAPVHPLKIKGFLWYQGESNSDNPLPYNALLPALIKDWRAHWNNELLPFLVAQLPNFQDIDYTPAESNIALLREAQNKALTLPNTAVTVTIDLGEWNDIHPLNKKEIGKRLALAARNLAYNEKSITYSGPALRSQTVEGGKIILTFDHVADGITASDDEPLRWFAIAGDDKKFVWAKAEMLGKDQIALWNDRVKSPRFVRYAWQDNPEGVNFYNSAGLPASPFRTDQAQRDSINKLTAIDHADMLRQLGISAGQLRKGPSGNPKDPNAANNSEAKVNRYTLPDPLVLKNGQKVQNTGEWTEKRRPEIVADFENELYGRLPANIPAVKWQVISSKDTVVGNQAIRQKMLKGIVDNAAFPSIRVEINLLLATPAAAASAVPVVLEFGFIRSPFSPGPIKPIGLGSPAEPTWQEQLISRGWGYAIIEPGSIQADNGTGLTAGIIGLVSQGKRRKPAEWGALRAWAWGASRAIDYFETDKDVDTKRLAIEGLSRYGKAAIVAMAFEPRIGLGFIGSSGAGGAKILRRVFGEQVENLASTGEYHWFAGNFIRYASTRTPDDLPVDAHELIALCAPRPVFISAGSPQVEGQWVDARGMFEAAVNAGPVYRLFGKKDLGTSLFPKLGMSLTDGEIAFRQHAGGHSTGPNWSTWIAWACRYWGDCKYD